MSAARHVRYGSLDCIVFDAKTQNEPVGSGDRPTIAVVLCHGYGAPGHDLAGLAPEWIRLLGDASESIRFVFPAAPHTLAELGMPDGRAWWPLNMAQLAAAMESSDFSDLHHQQPPGLDEARQMLCELIRDVKEDLIGDQTPLVLGGFSQGAMVAMDATLRGDFEPPELLIQFSGTLICESVWKASLSRLANTWVYQSHGMMDPILPFASAKALHELLLGGDVSTEFHPFPGPHTIDGESIAKTAMAIKGLVAKSIGQ